jgi:hypothetical protein
MGTQIAPMLHKFSQIYSHFDQDGSDMHVPDALGSIIFLIVFFCLAVEGLYRNRGLICDHLCPI